jgi:hypothetical protein
MIVLRRAEPQRNMRRFYALSLQSDLFGKNGDVSANQEPSAMWSTPTRLPLARRSHFE